MTYTVEKTTEPIKLESCDRVSLNEISQNAQDLFKQLEHLRSVLTLASETARDTFQIVYPPLDVNSISALVGSLSLSVELTNSIRPVRNIISSLKCLHYKQYKEYNLFLMSHSFSSELN
jgi:hypothetical protein